MFEVRVREWERLIDEDGSEPENERTHRNRNAKMVQNPIDLSWDLMGKYAAMQGAAMSEIWGFYIDAEWQPIGKRPRRARRRRLRSDLPRTEAQRRADALWQLFQDAAGADGSAVPRGLCTTLCGRPKPMKRCCADSTAKTLSRFDPDTYRCETIDGVPLEPTEAADQQPVAHGAAGGDRCPSRESRPRPGQSVHRRRPRRDQPVVQPMRMARLPSPGHQVRGRPPHRALQTGQNLPRQRGPALRHAQPNQTKRRFTICAADPDRRPGTPRPTAPTTANRRSRIVSEGRVSQCARQLSGDVVDPVADPLEEGRLHDDLEDEPGDDGDRDGNDGDPYPAKDRVEVVGDD